jgi:hypothetical protein
VSAVRESDRLEQTVRAIAHDDYGARHAPAGWLYAARFESRFIDADLVSLPVRRRAPVIADTSEDLSVASAQIDRIAEVSNVTRLYAALEDLVPRSWRDDGVDPAALFATDDTLGVVVIGAGPIGLAVASGLRLALGPSVNVLVVENRVSAPRQKRPYERRWLTAVGHDCLAPIVEARVCDILARVGTDQIGVSIDILETLLLLSCRRIGVRFLFRDDHAFIRERPVHLVFDATGNRLHPLEPDSTAISIGPPTSTDQLRVSERRLVSYGVDVTAPATNPSIEMASSGALRYPLYEGRRIVQAAFKITRLPARMCDALVERVARHNQDNKHYVWRGSLRDEVNQGLVIVNLTRAEYEALCAAHAYPLALAEVGDLRAMLDPRTVELLAFVAEGATESELARIQIDAPFTWSPYWIDERVPARLHDKLVVRVGDSIYNGNVKLANALGPHLRHVAHIQQMMWAHASSKRAELIARTMGLAR